MAVLDDRRLWWLSGALLFVLLSGLSVIAVGLLRLVGTFTGDPTPGTLFAVVVPYLVGLFVLAVVGTAMLAWLVLLLARHASDEFESRRLREVSERAAENAVVKLLR
ncbi:hypothetical protein [Halosegnis longus]|uniref:Uncharacterized protein n=1 Tax=Halosegnis longus TaxID=2216012 RepID=A0AAJ4R9N9_9EURY|nr:MULTISPECIES: hypothetical protein [Halobacteriales]RNJ26717.1 hypothetical protein Nmn1133_08550 [Salella cibi]